MVSSPLETQVRVSLDELREVCTGILTSVNVPEDHCNLCLEVLLTADLMGISTHGTRRLLPYVQRIRAGLINPTPDVSVHEAAPAVRRVNGDNGLGPVVGMLGLQAGIAAARRTGIAIVACHNSNHFGPGAPYARFACEEGMILMGGTNAVPTMPPTGSLEPRIGNNPVFVGVPRRDAPHFILDVALSVVARGKIRSYGERGAAIPEGWALDSSGAPTTDPLKALAGVVLPIADHKGYGMALAVELIAGVLSGGGFGGRVLSMYNVWDRPQNVGHFFALLDPTTFMPQDDFQKRVDQLLDEIKSASPVDPKRPVIYPGELEATSIARYENEGIPMDAAIWEDLQAFARGDFSKKVPER